MKKLMALGGNYFQMTAVKAAKRLGYYVIDVDYLPDNPAHKLADEYHNVSTLDKEKVLELARELQIDGIISYASDVSASTAAYVAEKMGLPTNPYESVKLMTRKDLFREFLVKNGFRVPQSETINGVEDAITFYDKIDGPIMIKPVDASGSKGVCRVNSKDEIAEAFAEASKYSNCGVVIAEEFVQREGYQIAGDAFIVDGEIRVFALANEHFDKLCNPLVPIGESFPCKISDEKREAAKKEIQRALSLLNMKFGAINLDFMFDKNGQVMILELGPRNGGNLITDAIKLASGVDLAEYTVKAALGDDISDLRDPVMEKCVSSYIVHSIGDGNYKGCEIREDFADKIKLHDMFVEDEEEITRFKNAAFGLGVMLIEFKDQEEMMQALDNMEEHVVVKYE